MALAVWVLRLAALVAPAQARDPFRARWLSRLRHLRILVDRGELPERAHIATLRLCRDAASAAVWLRLPRAGVARWMRGPAPVMAAAGLALAVVAVATAGFRATRSVIYTTIEWKIDPRTLRYDPRGDVVIAHFVPVLLALTVGAVLVAIGRLSLGRHGWRYWLFLLAKIAAVTLVIPLVWIEGGAALREHIPNRTLSVFIGGFGWTLAFLGVFGASVVWVFTDQRRRCPICLCRLSMPVRFGSWASVFDPVMTELLCDEGHGSLSVAETAIGERDRWIALDSSWRGL